MFLHAGAGLHGHEYSVKPSSQVPQHRHTLLRTALRPLSEYPSSKSHQDAYSFSSALEDGSSVSPPASQSLSPTVSLPVKESAVRFREPHVDCILPSDEGSVAGTDLAFESVSHSASLNWPGRQRAPRKSTCYALALPPSNKHHRLVKMRSRLLLQLQEVGDKRATPSFNVVPSYPNIFSPHLARRFPPIFRSRPQLGSNQVFVVRSDHSGPPSSASSVPGVDDRDVLAVISALPDDCADISLEDGSTWVAKPMVNGSFEFVTVDDKDRVVTARWARRSSKTTGFRWTFSVMDPSSRRHPVMGSLTDEAVEVYDSYSALSPSETVRRKAMVTQGQKNLMLATSTWISLYRQGWPTLPGSKSPTSLGWMSPPRRRTTFHCFDGSDVTAGAGPPPPRQSWPRGPESRSGFRSPLVAKVLPTVTRRNAGPSQSILDERGKKQHRGEKKSLCRARIWPWIRRLMDRGKRKTDVSSGGQRPEKEGLGA
ncbi:hypothetical protein GQ602_001358 [Ophiocordyceps camponoti-floridani]|uniref:Uncharacterized protein n=1 Tax=Ophiocordyceps camponoti-floridani TaxID=2030778 RepID=A0A8H4QDV6_9HYPO|nr:hypothetical protein GQ602_001358 [Ophiocordyceps camponoti-floridani]